MAGGGCTGAGLIDVEGCVCALCNDAVVAAVVRAGAAVPVTFGGGGGGRADVFTVLHIGGCDVISHGGVGRFVVVVVAAINLAYEANACKISVKFNFSFPVSRTHVTYKVKTRSFIPSTGTIRVSKLKYNQITGRNRGSK